MEKLPPAWRCAAATPAHPARRGRREVDDAALADRLLGRACPRAGAGTAAERALGLLARRPESPPCAACRSASTR
jgi:hypothetical protein